MLPAAPNEGPAAASSSRPNAARLACCSIPQPASRTSTLRRLPGPDSTYTRYGCAANPSRASSAAGRTSCAHGTLPWRRHSSASPCSSPGTATARPPSRDALDSRPGGVLMAGARMRAVHALWSSRGQKRRGADTTAGQRCQLSSDCMSASTRTHTALGCATGQRVQARTHLHTWSRWRRLAPSRARR